MAPIRAAIDLATRERLVMADIDRVVIKLHSHAVSKASDPRQNYPRDKETADHSYHYCVAAALLDGACGPAQFTDERIAASDIRDLIAKTQLEADSELTALWPKSSGGGVVVKLRDGRALTRVHKYPPGHPQNPLSDEEIANKFLELSNGVMAASNAQRVIDEIGEFEKCENVGDLLSHMIAV
jgi:2-methylcitrate dehydratase